MELRTAEIERVRDALSSNQSMLVLGESGAGKTSFARAITKQMEGSYSIAIAMYSGSSKETLSDIAEQLEVSTVTDDDKPKNLTAPQLKDALKEELTRSHRLLIVDDAHRFPASLRYWLEDCLKAGALILLLATNPPAKDIFLKMPRIEMQPLKNDEIRSLMYQEALAHGMTLNPSLFADLQQRAGNNPALAKRVVHEALLGIGENQSTDHQQYIDGTPFLVAGLTLVGIVRFIGMGLGDKSLYIIGGIAAMLAIAFRTIMFSVNRRSSRL